MMVFLSLSALLVLSNWASPAQGELATLQPADLPFESIEEKANQIARNLSLGVSSWRPNRLWTREGGRRYWAFDANAYVLKIDSRTGDLVRLYLSDGSHSVKPNSHRTGHLHFASDEDAKMELCSIANKLGVRPNAKMTYKFRSDDPSREEWGHYLASFKPDLGAYEFHSMGPTLKVRLDSETGRIVEIEQDRDFAILPTAIQLSENRAKDIAWQIYRAYCQEKEAPLRGNRETAVAKLGYAVQNGFNGTRNGWERAPFEARLVFCVRFGEPLQGSRIFDHIDVRADTGELWAGAVIGKLRGLPHSTALQHPEFE
ncbi:MAG: hypothetical protein UZ18_ATM001001796 [Armatimonadetes bacterium OLB18]|nr:MAG: hypothetical protein UZ18_ATM001001796 [Armatimonadetes bacterium OLB18]